MQAAIVTYYTGTCTASGMPCGGHYIAAPKRFAFGTRITFTTPSGKSVTGVVADRGPRIIGNHFDLSPGMFRKLGGAHWRRRGVLHVRAEATPGKSRRRHPRSAKNHR